MSGNNRAPKESGEFSSSLTTPLLLQASQQQEEDAESLLLVSSPASDDEESSSLPTLRQGGSSGNTLSDPLLLPPIAEESWVLGAENNEEQQQQQQQQETSTTITVIPLRGQTQPPAFRDAWWAVLFYLQVLLVLTTAIVLGPLMMRNHPQQQEEQSYYNLTMMEDTTTTTTVTAAATQQLELTWLGGNNNNNMYLLRFDKLLVLFLQLLALPLVAAMFSVLAVYALLERYSQTMVKASFWMTPVVFTALAVVNTLSANPNQTTSTSSQEFQIMGLWAVALFWTILAICHYLACRRSIPYTAANFQVALHALQSSRAALLGCAVATQIVLLLWWCVALVALGGVYAYYQLNVLEPCGGGGAANHHAANDELCPSEPGVWIYILWGLSLLWTQSVLQNVLRTTTAGVVGSWWFPLEEDHPPGNDVADSLYRSLTYSFGSICMGSLLVAVVQTLEQMTRGVRRRRQDANSAHHGGSAILCLLEYLLQLLGRLLDYVSGWAWCYVGLYGYSYLTAGKNVHALFRARGWSSIVTDRLAYRVLTYCKWIIAVLTGFLVVIMDMALDLYPLLTVASVREDGGGSTDERQMLRPIFFGVGTLAGLFFADVSFRVAEGAVRTILVCFAESPADAALWHPAEFACLRYGWMDSYPEEWPHVASFMFAQDAAVTDDIMGGA